MDDNNGQNTVSPLTLMLNAATPEEIAAAINRIDDVYRVLAILNAARERAEKLPGQGMRIETGL